MAFGEWEKRGGQVATLFRSKNGHVKAVANSPVRGNWTMEFEDAVGNAAAGT